MIEVKDLTVRYDKKVVFDKYNKTFKEGTITALVGPSGKGKTTLLRCIAGLNKATSGTILLNNKPINKPNKDIYMMHQHYSNFPWKTALQNVLFPIEIQRKISNTDIARAKLFLDKVGLKDEYDKYPSELSGGMNQRLAFARILMAKPKVILMDEPMSALDDTTRKSIQNLLKEMQIATKCTIIIITHDRNEASLLASEIVEI